MSLYYPWHLEVSSGCNNVWSCKYTPTFRRYLIPPSLGLNLLSSSFLRECSFNFLQSFTNIWTLMAHFQRIFINYRYIMILPAVWWRDANIYFAFSAFASRPTFLPVCKRASVFFVMIFMFPDSKLTSSA
jgi:hypothetical protein